MRFIYTIFYIAFIVLCNTVFTYVPSFSLFNRPFSIGDVMVGGVYVLRDLSQREIQHYVIIAMMIGGIISYLMADKEVAVASIIAFTVGETIDWIIYTVTKKPLSQRLLWSSLISVPIDSVIFLYLTNMLNWLGLAVMLMAKTLGVMALWFSWKIQQPRNACESLA